MTSINLYEYIKNGLLIKNIEDYNIYDTIIMENFDNTEIEFNNGTKIKNILDENCGFGNSGLISGLTKNSKNVLIIIDKLSINYLIPFISNTDINYTIINLGVGIAGIGNKSILDIDDIGILNNFELNIYEPIDFNNLIKILNHGGNKYIRISNKELPYQIFDQDYDYNGLISLTEHGFSGYDGTILCGGYLLTDCIDALRMLQDEGKFYNLYTISNYNFEFSEITINTLNGSENIYLVLDQNKNNLFEKILFYKLNKNSIFEGKIHGIYPLVNEITTNNIDYLFESGKINNNAIYNYLK